MRRLCIVIDRPRTLGTDWRGQRSKSPPADSHRGVGLDSTREKLDRRTSSGLDPMTQWAPLSGRRENSSFFLQDVVENSWDILLGTQIGKPVPREHALDSDHQSPPIRCNQLQEPFRSRWDVPLDDRLALGTENADIHCPGMEIDTS